jgi:hypothetical protein
MQLQFVSVNHMMHPSRRSAANLNHSFLAATWVIAAVRCLASDFVVLVLSKTVLVLVIESRQPRRSTFWVVIGLVFIELQSKPVRMVALRITT